MTEEKKCLVDGSPITDDFNELHNKMVHHKHCWHWF